MDTRSTKSSTKSAIRDPLEAATTIHQVENANQFAVTLSGMQEWYRLGAHLKLPPETLELIESRYKSDGNFRCLVAVYQRLTMEVNSVITWETVVKSLEAMGYYGLAEKIEAEFINTPFSSDQPHPFSPAINIPVGDGIAREYESLFERLITLKCIVKETFLTCRVPDDPPEILEGKLRKIQDFLIRRYGLQRLQPNEATVDAVFDRLEEQCSILHIKTLEFVVNEEGLLTLEDKRAALVEKMADFKQSVEKFKYSANMLDLVTRVSDQYPEITVDESRVVKLKLRDFWSDFTMKQFQKVVKEILQDVYEFVSRISVKKPHCICVNWLIPDDLDTTKLIKELPLDFIRAIGVIYLHIGKEVFYSLEEEGCETIEAAMIQAFQLKNTRAMELLISVGCNPDILAQNKPNFCVTSILNIETKSQNATESRCSDVHNPLCVLGHKNHIRAILVPNFKPECTRCLKLEGTIAKASLFKANDKLQNEIDRIPLLDRKKEVESMRLLQQENDNLRSLLQEKDARLKELKNGREPSTPHQHYHAKLAQALKQSLISLSITKSLFQGPPRVGKTHVKCLLLKQKLPERSLSTPCAEHPQRAIRKVATEAFTSVTEKHARDEHWELIDDDYLGHMISSIASDFKGSANSTSQKDLSHSFTMPSSSGKVLDSLQEKVEKEKIKKPNPKMKRQQDLLYLIDSGGQPQLEKVIQAFIPNTSILLLAFNLTQKLSESPLAIYQTDKGSMSLGKYAISNEEIITRFARMVYSSNTKVHVACIGTHYDLYSKSPTSYETIEEKNDRLLKIFSFCKDHLLYYNLMSKSLLFPIDGLQAVRGEFDDPVVCQLRKAIGSTSKDASPIDVPLRWYALELAMQKQAIEDKSQVLSMESCIRLSKDLQFTEDEVPVAIEFLSKYNLILYYHDVLPDVVFTSPQVFLDKVTELTQCVYELSHYDTNKDEQHAPPSRGDYLIMRDEGIVSEQILMDFPTHYRPNIFGPKELVKIFEYLYIISRRDGNGSYFMPALLPPFTPDELMHLLDPTHPPLLFEFNESCAPTGLFCAVLVCLTGPAIGWEVAHHLSNAPLHGVRSNAACLTAPGLRFLIILVDSLNQFEVHYRCPHGEEEYGLPRISLTITEALEKVIHKRKFKIMFPRKAFFCQAPHHENVPSAGSNPVPRHIAVSGHKRNQLICSINPMAESKMMDSMYYWLAPVVAESAGPSGDDPFTIDSSAPSLREIMLLMQSATTKWDEIGLHLGPKPERKQGTKKVTDAEYRILNRQTDRGKTNFQPKRSKVYKRNN